MERRDMSLPNSLQNNYNNPSQVSPPVKLPLAPILSTPPERRSNAMLSTTRRGSSIFSPTLTLDHTRNPPPLPPPPPQPISNPDPAAIPSNSKNLAPPPQANDNDTSIKYRECLKNHAASMGGHIVDGCGEFMPSGDENTAEALRCAACDCHRNFHRKEINGEQPQPQPQPQPQQQNQYNVTNNNKQHNKQHTGFASGAGMVNFGGGGAGESSSEDLNMYKSGRDGHAGGAASSSKKRFRTKFSQDQKDKMHEFATSIEWRIQKENDEDVHKFCNEVGIKRQVFKVWMHNNKQAMKRMRQSSDD